MGSIEQPQKSNLIRYKKKKACKFHQPFKKMLKKKIQRCQSCRYPSCVTEKFQRERERNEIKNELGRKVTVSSANNIMTPLQNSQHPPFIHQHNHGLTILSNFPSHTTFKNKTTQKSNHYSQSKSHNYNANQHKHIYKNSTFFL